MDRGIFIVLSGPFIEFTGKFFRRCGSHAEGQQRGIIFSHAFHVPGAGPEGFILKMHPVVDHFMGKEELQPDRIQLFIVFIQIHISTGQCGPACAVAVHPRCMARENGVRLALIPEKPALISEDPGSFQSRFSDFVV